MNVPKVLLEKATSVQYAVTTALIAMTIRGKYDSPKASEALLSRVLLVVGNRAGKTRASLGPMRKDQLLRHLQTLCEAGWLHSYRIEKRRTGVVLKWQWDGSLRDDLRGFGHFAQLPKAVAWDGSLSGAEKKVYTALHYLRYINGHHRDWTQPLLAGHTFLGDLTGMHRNSVSPPLHALHDAGLITVTDRGERKATGVAFVPVTARYVRMDTTAYDGMRRQWRLWMRLDELRWQTPGRGARERDQRVELFRGTGAHHTDNPRYWNGSLAWSENAGWDLDCWMMQDDRIRERPAEQQRAAAEQERAEVQEQRREADEQSRAAVDQRLIAIEQQRVVEEQRRAAQEHRRAELDEQRRATEEQRRVDVLRLRAELRATRPERLAKLHESAAAETAARAAEAEEWEAGRPQRQAERAARIANHRQQESALLVAAGATQ